MKALIIGGGITGPTAALALHKAGIDAEVFEAYRTTAHGIGASLMIAPNGMNALAVVGADQAVRSCGRPNNRMVMLDGRGKLLGEFKELSGVPTSQLLDRSELYAAIGDHAAAQGIRVQYGKRLVSVDEHADSVTAHFADGTSATGDVLIGADGVNSTVRGLIDPNAPGARYTGLLGFGGYLPGNAVGAEQGSFYFVQGKRSFLGYALTPDGDTGWFSNLPHSEYLSADQVRQTSNEQWLARLLDAHTGDIPAEEFIRQTKPEDFMSVGPMAIMPKVPHWHRGRMVLVGDSAHAPSNSSGQGASLSIEGAIELARCLRDLPVPQALATYESTRRPRVERVAAYGEKVNQQKASGPIARTLTSLLAPIVMKTVFTPEKMFGWVHRYQIDWEARVLVDEAA